LLGAVQAQSDFGHYALNYGLIVRLQLYKPLITFMCYGLQLIFLFKLAIIGAKLASHFAG